MSRFLLSRLRARGRASAIFLSFLAAAVAPQSWGLGLGEIELNSALNQDFSATIELFDASGLEPGEIIVSLGSSEDFDRVGVERFFFLTSLSFEVSYDKDGEAQVLVTSSRPITEPYLNFLVEVHWPNGRLLKEFTVLLDPPTFSEAAAPAVSAPAQSTTAGNTGRVQRAAPAQTGTRVQVTPEAPVPAAPSPLDAGFDAEEYGMTDRDDTLWSIASRARPSRSVSVQQTMLAIAEMNPEAFINGNINLLKAGYVLKLPDEARARTRSAQDALGEVARHNEEWNAYNRGEMIAERNPQPARQVADQTSDLRSPVDASSTTTPAANAQATDGELRIVAEDGDSTTGVGTDVAAADLNAAMEETDRLGRQVDELTYALDREKELASSEIAIRERQLEVKDQQIAELQAQLAAARQAEQFAATQPAAPSDAADSQTQSQNQNASAEAAPWWQSPMVMYGGAGLLVLLLVGGMVAQRRRRAAEEENDYFDAEGAFADEDRQEPAMGAFAEDADEADEYDDTLAATDDDPHLEEEPQGSQTSDVIGEADIYIAYGRYPQAIGLLLGVLEDEPERNDVRIKLLEVYAESGDRASFDEHMTALIEYCDDEEALLTARELENQLGEEAITLDDMLADEQSGADAADIAAEIDAEADTVDSAELDDIEYDTDGLVDSNESAASAGLLDETIVDRDLAAADAAEPEESDSALDFELELDELDAAEEEKAAEDAALDGAGDQLGGDLGLDFDPDAADTDDAAEDVAQTAESDNGGGYGQDRNAQPAGAAASERSGFAETEELTIDSDLEQAAASISEEAADLQAELDAGDDLPVQAAVETAVETELLDDLDLETMAQGEEEFEFEDEGDSANTKLDLARAYIDMGDADGARDILREVLDEGNSDQQQKAQSMLESL